MPYASLAHPACSLSGEFGTKSHSLQIISNGNFSFGFRQPINKLFNWRTLKVDAGFQQLKPMDKDSRRSSTPKPFKFSIFGKSKTNLDGAEAPSSAAAAMDATTPANDTALDKTPDMTDLSSIPKAYETGKQATASKPIFSYWFKSNTTRPIQQPVSFLSNDSLKEDGMGHERQNADLPAHEGPLSEEESSADSQDDSHDILITPHHKDISTDERVRIAFELPNVDKVEYEFACWLVQAVLLKGYMYVTSTHICFHAALPSCAVRVV